MKIAFTSCIRYEAFPIQEEWKYIEAQKPDYLFLLGDTIYMDYGIFGPEHNGAPAAYTNTKFALKMEQKYKNQFEKVAPFTSLLNMVGKNFYAIWDDHDFAWDNSTGKEVSKSSNGDNRDKRDISRELFHKYTNCSTNRPYVYYTVDTELARVLFIDNRFDSDFEKGILLSDAQFDFIEAKLQHTLPYTIICGGLTLTEGHENWQKYPLQLERLCELLKDRKKVFYLAGDIHRNAFISPKPYYTEHGNHFVTSCQLISSGMAIDYLDITSLPFDDRHCWATLELTPEIAHVAFYKSDKIQVALSNEANLWIKNNI